MGDPLGTTAAIVGIVAGTLHASRLVYDDIKTIAEAPDTIVQLRSDVDGLNQNLQLVKAIEAADWEKLGTNAADRTTLILKSCEQACTVFHGDLERWTRHSTNGGLSRRDRLQLGFYRQKEIKSFSQQLQSCKLSFTNILSSANLHSSLRNGATNENLNKTLVTYRDNTTAQNAQLQKQLDMISTTLTELVCDDSPEPSEDDSEDRGAAIAQVKEERATLNASKALLEELFAKCNEEINAQAQGPSVTQENKFGDNNHGNQVGINHGGITQTLTSGHTGS